MRCVLVGNYGVGNIGDEALRHYFLSEFRDITWTVVTASPSGSGEVPRLPLGLRSLLKPRWKTIRAIQQADALVFGGGSLFTDIESVWACVIWRAYALVARAVGTPVVLAFQGVGPWHTALGHRLARKTCEEASFVSVRDEESLQRLQSFRLTGSPVLTFDPAFALFAAEPRTPVSRRLVVIPRTNSDDQFFTEVRRKLSEGFTEVRILLMQPDSAERRVGERLREMCDARATVIDMTSVPEFLREVSAASEVLSQRYHGALAAFAMGIPVRAVPQASGDKMDVFNRLASRAGSKEALLRAIAAGAEALRKALVTQ